MSAEGTVQDHVLVRAGLTEKDCRIDVAIRLRALRRITMKEALRLSRLSRIEFEGELARRGAS